MMKKFSLLLAAVMLLTCLAGCNPPVDPTDPTPTTPTPTDPAPTDPTDAPTDPAGPTDPAPTDPAPTDPAPTDPPATDPAPTDPPATDPAPTDPPATDPAPTDPPATEPAPTDPIPTDPASENVIFICDGAAGDGSSAESPLKPTTGNYVEEGSRPERDQDAALYQAWQKLMAQGGGTIVICGPYTLDDSNCQPIGSASADFMMPVELHDSDISITYTSVWGGVDYRKTNGAKLIMAGKSHLTFPTTTIFENITVSATADNVDHYLCAALHPFILKKGTNFVPYDEQNIDSFPMILGAFRNNATAIKEGDSCIIVDIGEVNRIGNIYGMCNGGNGKHTGDSHITVISGSVGGIYGDSRATGQVPLCGTVYMNLEGGSYRGLIAGLNVGFSGNCAKTVNITVTGGNFSFCRGIVPVTTAVEASLPAVVNVDCSRAPLRTVQQVEGVTASAANLILPDGYKIPIVFDFTDQYGEYITNEELDLRQIVVDYMYAMANIKWTAGILLDYSSLGAPSLIYEPGKTYLGMVYNNNKNGLEGFQAVLNEDNLYIGTVTDWNTSPGNSCATSIEHAWQQISPSVEYSYSADMLPYYASTGVIAVGNIDWSCYSNKNTNTVVAQHDSEVIFQAYALTLPGDALVRYLSTGGHALMVTKNPVVVYNSDGTIDMDNSYLYLTDQNNRLHNRREYPSSWEVDRAVSFASALNDGYLPVTTAELRDGKTPVPVLELTGISTEQDVRNGDICGNLKSNYCINTVHMEIRSGDTVVTSATEHPYTRTYSFITLGDKLNVAGLPDGKYTLVITAEVAFGSKTLVELEFTQGDLERNSVSEDAQHYTAGLRETAFGLWNVALKQNVLARRPLC